MGANGQGLGYLTIPKDLYAHTVPPDETLLLQRLAIDLIARLEYAFKVAHIHYGVLNLELVIETPLRQTPVDGGLPALESGAFASSGS